MDKEPFTVQSDTEPLMTDYNRDTKLSLKGKFGAELCKEILDVDLEASDEITLDIKFGKVDKSEIREPELLNDLSKRYTMAVFAFCLTSLAMFSISTQYENMSMKCILPQTPLLYMYSKTVVCKGIPIFFIFAPKHR